jgi:hypothetical protein
MTLQFFFNFLFKKLATGKTLIFETIYHMQLNEW